MRDPVTRRLLREGRGGRSALALIGVLGTCTAVLVVAQAALLGPMLADAALHGAIPGVTAVTTLAAVWAARIAVGAGTEIAGRFGAVAVMSELRDRIGARLLDARPGLPAGARSGELATTAVEGVDGLEGWFARYLPQLVLSALVTPAALGFVLIADPPAGLVLALAVPVLILFMVLVGLGARAHAAARWRALTVLGAHFADVVRGLATLRAHGRETAQAEVVGAVADDYRRSAMDTLRVAFLSAFVLELTAMIGTALVAATVGLQLVAGDLALGTGLAVLLLAPELFAPLRALGQEFHAAEDGLAAAGRLFAVLDAPAGDVATGDAPVPDPCDLPLVGRALHYTHPGADVPVLLGCDLTIGPGETVAVIGASGAGKTTLTALLLRQADPQQGRLRCGTTDLRDVDPDAWRACVAWVPQRPAIVHDTVAANIRLGSPFADDQAVRTAAWQAEVDLDATPLDLVIGDGGRGLSAGQRQRIALARAFLRDAPLVVVDEPTAHLDPGTAAALQDALLELCADRTALIVTHDLALAARADRVLELRDGLLTDATQGVPA